MKTLNETSTVTVVTGVIDMSKVQETARAELIAKLWGETEDNTDWQQELFVTATSLADVIASEYAKDETTVSGYTGVYCHHFSEAFRKFLFEYNMNEIDEYPDDFEEGDCGLEYVGTALTDEEVAAEIAEFEEKEHGHSMSIAVYSAAELMAEAFGPARADARATEWTASSNLVGVWWFLPELIGEAIDEYRH
jgi:hypothetical protein